MLFRSFFFLFKQKTAYEMRISDWSSDVCSSDLLYPSHDYFVVCAELRRDRVQYAFQAAARLGQHGIDHATAVGNARLHDRDIPALVAIGFGRFRRSEARRVGKEGVRTCRSRWSP